MMNYYAIFPIRIKSLILLLFSNEQSCQRMLSHIFFIHSTAYIPFSFTRINISFWLQMALLLHLPGILLIQMHTLRLMINPQMAITKSTLSHCLISYPNAIQTASSNLSERKMNSRRCVN